MEIKYKPKTKEELKTLCDDLSVNLGEIDTSKITDMGSLFFCQTKRSDYSGIENWDVSNVEYMECMFYRSKFNGDISKWDTSNVKNMAWMFAESKFNGDISKWDTSNVKNMAWMFQDSPLEKIVKTMQWDWSKYHETK